MGQVDWVETHYGHHAEPWGDRILLDVVQDEQQLLWWCAIHLDGKVVLECWSNTPDLMRRALETIWENWFDA